MLSRIAEAVTLLADLIKGIVADSKTVSHRLHVLSDHLPRNGQDLFRQIQRASSNAVAEMLSQSVETSLKVNLLLFNGNSMTCYNYPLRAKGRSKLALWAMNLSKDLA